jgi:hypothetical protein
MNTTIPLLLALSLLGSFTVTAQQEHALTPRGASRA